jgi:hypothetical protein
MDFQNESMFLRISYTIPASLDFLLDFYFEFINAIFVNFISLLASRVWQTKGGGAGGGGSWLLKYLDFTMSWWNSNEYKIIQIKIWFVSEKNKTERPLFWGSLTIDFSSNFDKIFLRYAYSSLIINLKSLVLVDNSVYWRLIFFTLVRSDSSVQFNPFYF